MTLILYHAGNVIFYQTTNQTILETLRMIFLIYSEIDKCVFPGDKS